MGSVTFYKSKAGYLAREKGGVDGQRIATDPAFQRTRENGSEFGRAGKAGKLLRSALRMMLQNVGDSYMVGRLTREFVKVIRADATSVRGQRNVIDGETELLQGFDFNINGRLQRTLFAPYVTGIDRVTGALTVDVPSFIPVNMIAAPAGASHYRAICTGAEIDFQTEEIVSEVTSSAELPLDSIATVPLNLVASVTPNSTKPLFLALGIEFYQQVNGAPYALRNGAFNAISLVKVSGGV